MVSLNAALAALALSAGGPTVMYDFCADWCGPCRAMSPTVEALAARGFPVEKVNIDQRPDLARKYRVGPIPCFVMVVDGREVDRQVGATSLGRLEQMCRLGAQAKSPARPAIAATTSAGAATTAVSNASHTAPATGNGARGWSPQVGRDGLSDEQLLAVTVRLRVADPRGFGWGTGTIVDARQGEALILTCGHLFRDSQGKGRIDIDLFGPHEGKRVQGNLIGYDLKRDVALVSIKTPGPIEAARLAPPDYTVRPGDPVVGVGCSNGDNPTIAHTRVASVNRFLGPPNLQVVGEPIEGRSGGGLFSREGLVIGVCNGAQRDDHEGFFAALGSIHGHIGDVGLAHVFQSSGPSKSPQLASTRPGSVPTMPKSMPAATVPGAVEDLPRPGPSLASSSQAVGGNDFTRPLAAVDSSGAASSAETDATPLSRAERAALDEIRRRLDEGAEVVCVIRSRTDPSARSEIIMLDRVSPAFLKELAAESRRGGAARPLTAGRSGESSPAPLVSSPRQTLPSIAPTAAEQPSAAARWAPSDGHRSAQSRVVPVRPPVESQASAD